MEGYQGVEAFLDADCNLHSDVLNQSPVLLMILQCSVPWPGVHLLVDLHVAVEIYHWRQVLVAGGSAESWKTLAWVSGPMLVLRKLVTPPSKLSVTACL